MSAESEDIHAQKSVCGDLACRCTVMEDLQLPPRDTVNQRFFDMNRQIIKLTNLVLALTEKISSSNREGNELNTV